MVLQGLCATADSSPGPDGLPYSAWGANDESIHCLYSVLQAIASGAAVPEWFNAALLISIPKKAGPNAAAYSARAANFRPLTLADTSQKLIARAVEHALIDVTVCCVHSVQTGFVGGRSMLESVLRIEGAIEEYLYHEGRQCGVFLFDVAAAFPSIAQDWLWMVLRAMNVPPWRLAAIGALYAHAGVNVLWGGIRSPVVLPIRSGIKQWCPASGRLWAIGYDPIVRSVLHPVPRHLGCLGVFADDLGLAALDIAMGIAMLDPVFGDMARAANLKMQGGKTRLLYFGVSGLDDVHMILARSERFSGVQIAGHEKYLGVEIGIGASACRWTAPLAKFQARVRHVSNMPLHLHQRLQAYGMYALSVMRFTAQVAPVPSEVRRVEQAAHARMLRAPMHSLGPGLLPFLSEVGGASLVADLPLTAEAAAIRCWQAHSRVLQEIEERIRTAAMADTALLVHPCSEWRENNLIVHMRRAADRCAALPPEVRTQSASQRALYVHLSGAAGAGSVRTWLRRRLATLLGAAPDEGEVEVCLKRLRILFETLPAYVALATLRAIGNAWPTSRRIGGAPNRCAYGCATVGGDDIAHYFACPLLRAVMFGSAARVPGWAHEGHMRIVALTLPLSTDQVVISGVWAYIAYALFCDACARERPRSTEEFIVTARAEVRSLCTRVPIAHKALFSAEGGLHRLPRRRRGNLGL